MAQRVAASSKLWLAAAALAVCIVLLSLDFVSAARGGGGSRGGGSRSGGSRSSSRSSSSSSRSSSSSTRVRTRVSVSTTRVRYGSRYYVVAPSVHIYGYSSYKSRHLYASSHDDDPTVCYSEEETGDNGTALGYFVCPMEDSPDSYSYCCGDDDEQYCCDFWGDSGRAAGAVIGILFGVALMIAAVVVMWKCCCQNKASLSVRKETVTVVGATACETVPLNSMPPAAAAEMPHQRVVPTVANENVPPFMQPGAGAALPYPPQPAAAYEASQVSGPGLPYPVSPPIPGTQFGGGASYSHSGPYGQPVMSGEAKPIGFEAVGPEPPGLSPPYPAQQHVQPPPYSEAVRL